MALLGLEALEAVKLAPPRRLTLGLPHRVDDADAIWRAQTEVTKADTHKVADLMISDGDRPERTRTIAGLELCVYYGACHPLTDRDTP